MAGRVAVRRRLAAALAASLLLVALLLAWQLRPPFPAAPHSFSSPLTGSEVGAALQLAAWALFVLLDLVLLARVVAVGAHRQPARAELRLRRALSPRRDLAEAESHNWRRHAKPPGRIFYGYSAAPDPAPAGVAVLEPTPTRADDATGEDEESADGRVGVRLLGRFELIGSSREQPQRKSALELIAYLALQPRGATRDELLEALWPDQDPHRSEHSFWQASTEARKLLHGGLRRKRDRYLLDRKHVTVDLDQLEHLHAQARDAASAAKQRELSEQALALIHGQPLAGIDTPWAQAETRRLQALQLELHEQVGRQRLDAGEPAGALETAERALALDACNERLVQLAMEAEAALGRREAVIERYDRLCRDLDERLGLQPEQDTRRLHRHLLSQDPAGRGRLGDPVDGITEKS